MSNTNTNIVFFNILECFPVYLSITAEISRCDCILLSRTCKTIYNIMMMYGFLEVLDCESSEKYKNMIKNHMRTLKYLNFYKQKHIFEYIPVLNNKIQLRIRNCRELRLNNSKNINESIKSMIILDEKHDLSVDNLNKLCNLEYLGIEHIEQSDMITLNKLKTLKIYGNINIEQFNCENLWELFYYVSKNNEVDEIKCQHFKKCVNITIFLSIYTKLRVIKINNSVKNLKIIVNNIIYEKNFDNIPSKHKHFRKIQNITHKNNIITIKPVISMFDNLYYY